MKEKRVLLADSSEACTMLTEHMLKDIGIADDHIVTIKDGTQALDIARKELFDLIIINTRLRGMGGQEVAEQIRAQHNGSSPKIIGYVSEELENGYPFDVVIRKPSDPDEFSKKIVQLLGGDDKR